MIRRLLMVCTLAGSMLLGARDTHALDAARMLHLLNEGRVEAVYNEFRTLLEKDEPSLLELPFYHSAAMWLTFAMSDHRQALSLIQIGLNHCQELAKKGQAEAVFFDTCRLLRSKAQVLSLMGKIDAARKVGDEAVQALWQAYQAPPPGSRLWKDITHFGFVTLFSFATLPVEQAAFESEGTAGAQKHVDWVLESIGRGMQVMSSPLFQSNRPMVENYTRTLEVARAEALFLAGREKEAYEVVEKLSLDPGGDLAGKSYLGTMLITRARIRNKVGKKAEALADLALATRIMEAKGPIGGNFAQHLAWTAPFTAGQIHEEAGEVDAAIVSYQESAEKLKKLYSSLHSTYARTQFLKDSDKVYLRLVRLLLVKGRIEDALSRLEESESKQLLDMMGDQLKDQYRTWPAAIRKKADEIKKQLLDLDVAPTGGTGQRGGSATRSPAERRSVKLKLRHEYGELLRQLPPPRAAAPADPGTLGQWLTGLLGTTSTPSLSSNDRFTTLVFLVRQDPCYVLVLGKGMTQVVALTAHASDIRTAARQLRDGILARKPEWTAASRTLFQQLLGPLKGAMPESGDLVIVPDGDLWYIPFAALLDDTGAAIGEKHAISLTHGVGVASRYLAASTRAATISAVPRAIACFANPDGSLPATVQEVNQIAQLKNTIKDLVPRVLIGPEATEAAFKATASTPGVLHLATHGVLDPVSPLFSFLLLAPAPGEDGRLSLIEIATELDLRGSPLAVLSACNTAMGEMGGGNEMICLGQAFAEAGVPRVVASLWEVSDSATASLMAAFYQNLAGGSSPGESLRRAMLREARGDGPAASPPKYRDPYLWSAFQLYGLP